VTARCPRPRLFGVHQQAVFVPGLTGSVSLALGSRTISAPSSGLKVRTGASLPGKTAEKYAHRRTAEIDGGWRVARSPSAARCGDAEARPSLREPRHLGTVVIGEAPRTD